MYLSISIITALPSSAYEGLGKPDQQHLIHFTGIVTAQNGLELDRLATLVRPVGYPALEDENPLFGITSFISATQRGLAAEEVLRWCQSRAREATLVIGHDVHQDLRCLEATAALLGVEWQTPTRIFSTLYGAIAAGIVPHVMEPDGEEPADIGLPTLADCFKKATGEPLQGALGIRSNADAALKVFRHIRWLLTRQEP